MSEELARTEQLSRAIRPALIGGAVCLGLIGLGAIYDPSQFFRSWLYSWFFWFGISMGSMGIIMMHYLLGGAWGYMIRRFGEAAAMCIPLLAVLFIPIILGVRFVYPWAVPYEVAHDPVLQHKVGFLNWPAWSARSVTYLLVFSVLAWLLRTTSLASDRTTPAIPLLTRLRRVSTGGLVIYFVLMSLASVDWVMSREPHWISTVFGFVVCISQAISGCCVLILMLVFLADEPPFKEVLHPNYLNDLGNVLLTFVILWAYLSFAQFLVIWLGNSQTEIVWYIRRTDGGWRWVAAALMGFHFLVPFILLLQRPLKRHKNRLAALVLGLLVMRAVDVLYWMTPGEPHGIWGPLRWAYAEGMNVVALLGIGGVWVAMFLWLLEGKSPLPIGDRVPVISVDHGHGQRPAPGTVE